MSEDSREYTRLGVIIAVGLVLSWQLHNHWKERVRDNVLREDTLAHIREFSLEIQNLKRAARDMEGRISQLERAVELLTVISQEQRKWQKDQEMISPTPTS